MLAGPRQKCSFWVSCISPGGLLPGPAGVSGRGERWVAALCQLTSWVEWVSRHGGGTGPGSSQGSDLAADRGLLLAAASVARRGLAVGGRVRVRDLCPSRVCLLRPRQASGTDCVLRAPRLFSLCTFHSKVLSEASGLQSLSRRP